MLETEVNHRWDEAKRLNSFVPPQGTGRKAKPLHYPRPSDHEQVILHFEPRF